MKKLCKLLLAIVLVLTLSGCFKQVEDTNGPDDYTIQTYTDKDITYGNKKHVFIGALENSIGNHGSLKVSKFSGIYDLYKVNASNQRLEFNITAKCSSGNFRVVIVHDNEIIYNVKINQNDVKAFDNCDGNYTIVIVGESAKIDVNYMVIKG
jgi:hypothetical protein